MNDLRLLMRAKQCHKPCPSHHNFDRWYVYHSQSWVVYGIVLPTLMAISPTFYDNGYNGYILGI